MCANMVQKRAFIGPSLSLQPLGLPQRRSAPQSFARRCRPVYMKTRLICYRFTQKAVIF